jgi:steroid 5-alpha reductase family enzyme
MIDTMLWSLAIIFVIQVLFFIFASMLKTDKVTDLAYGMTFVILSWIWLFYNGIFDLMHVLLATMITLWGVRLAGYLFYRIMKIKKDARFDGIREHFWKFAGFWTVQTIIIFIVMLPVIMLLNIKSIIPLTTISIIGFFIWLFGFLTETIADHQKFTFRNNPKNKGKWIDTGLWHYSRHPNYFGEILCWIGVFVYVIPVLSGASWIAIISPISITAILLFFSGIPPLERKEDEMYGKNKEYRKYKKTTSVLIPWFKN